MTRDVLTCQPAHPGAGRGVTIRIGPQVINLLAADGVPSYSFDRVGRLIGGFVGGKNYRRSLDNRVLQKWAGDDGTRQRRWLAPAEAQAFLDEAYRLAAQAALAAGDDRLRVLCAWDWAALQADADRFAQIYRPVSILPPDQYLALVLQATEGCSYNRCTFCDFYRDRPFRVKAPDEFRAHVAAVRDFFGQAIGLRRSIFLADANALVAPMARLRSWLDVIEASRVLPGAGIYSFIDAFGAGRKTQAEWAELAARGLRRVYIGLESGDDGLLRFLRKPNRVADAIAAVATLKAAAVAVSVIVMTGIGGSRLAADHVAGTVATLNAMPLGAGDILYFSPFVDTPGSEYGRLAAEAGIRPLAGAEVAAQEAAIREGLRPRDPAHPPQCSRYDIREFIY